MAADVEIFSQIIAQVVGVQVQFREVDKVHARGQNLLLFLQKALIQFGSHGGFDAHVGNVLFSQGNGFDHAVGAAGGPQVEPQFIQPRPAQGLQIFGIGQGAVGVEMLMYPGGVEFFDDGIVFLNFHEGLQVDIGNAGGLFAGAQQKLHVFHPVFAPADFPHALADGGLLIQFAIVIAEFALDVALVGFADGGQPRARKAGSAAPGEFRVVAHV